MNFQKYLSDRYLEPDLIAEDIGIQGKLLYEFVGLDADRYKSVEAIRSGSVQTRLVDMIGIIDYVEPRFNSLLSAYAWFQSKPLPRFSSKTAMQLVQEGRSVEIMEYLRAVDVGVYA